MSENRHHFVLVHGACHGAWCWYKVVTLLRSAGNVATALDMAGCGRDPNRVEDVPTIFDYFQPLMHFMEALPANEKVILVAHSKGGIDISMAMEKFPTKVTVGVFITAVMPGPNLDTMEIMQEHRKHQSGFQMDHQYYYNDGNEKRSMSVLIGPEVMASKIYDLSPPEDLTLAKLSIRPSPLHDDFKAYVLTEQNYGSVRRVYVVCEEDKLRDKEMARWMFDRNPPDEVKVIEGSDHMPMMSKPQELCSCLQEIAARYCS